METPAWTKIDENTQILRVPSGVFLYCNNAMAFAPMADPHIQELFEAIEAPKKALAEDAKALRRMADRIKHGLPHSLSAQEFLADAPERFRAKVETLIRMTSVSDKDVAFTINRWAAECEEGGT
jgi:hypothetical protein